MSGIGLASAFSMIVGLLALVFGYEAIGKVGPSSANKGWRRIHRVTGYAFLLLFLILFFTMIDRLAYAHEFSNVATMHAALAFFAMTVLVVKLFIVRRYKKFASSLYVVGSVLWSLVTVLTALMIGSALDTSAVAMRPDSTVAEKSDLAPSKLLPVENRMVYLCAQCHPLGQVLHSLRNEAKAKDWPDILTRMQKKSAEITVEDARQITAYFQQFYP